MASLRAHRRQWFVSIKKDIPLSSGWAGYLCRKLACDRWLFHDSELSVQTRTCANGDAVLVLGLVLGALESADATYLNVGRFVLIHGAMLHLDATGSMGVYYVECPESIVCGSSLPIMAELCGVPLVGRDLMRQAMNWDPVPMTRARGIRRLMVGQGLDLMSAQVVKQRRTIRATTSVQGAARALATLLVEDAKAMAGMQRPLFLAMTGGADSRTVFSALISAEVPFQAFTLRLGDEQSEMDARIAAKLCRRYGVKHDVIDASDAESNDVDEFAEHSGGIGGDRTAEYVAGSYYRDIPDSAVLVHGGCFEIGKRFYERAFREIRTDSAEQLATTTCRHFGGMTAAEHRALMEWYEYRTANSIQNVDWCDLFYIDQRRGGWGAVNRQEEDIFGFDWLIMANGWRIIDLLLSVPIEARLGAEVQLSAMEYMLPGIATRVKINPSTPPHRRMLRSLRVWWWHRADWGLR